MRFQQDSQLITVILLAVGFIVNNAAFSKQPELSKATCLIVAEPECLAQQTMDLAQKPTISSADLQSKAAQLTIEINFPNRSRAWPYEYESKRINGLKKLLNSPLLKPTSTQVKNLIQQQSTGPQTRNYSISRCLKMKPEDSSALIQALVCYSPRYVQLSHLNMSTSFPMEIQSLLLSDQFIFWQHLHSEQLRFGYIEKARQAKEHIIKLASDQTPSVKQKQHVHIVTTQLSLAYHQLADQELKKITFTSGQTSELNNSIEILYTWHDLLQYSRSVPKRPQTDSETMADFATTILASDIHQRLLQQLEVLPIHTQVAIHRQIASGFFQSFFNLSEAHDSVLAYHLSLWQQKQGELKLSNQILEHLDMLLLELRMGSLLDSQNYL